MALKANQRANRIGQQVSSSAPASLGDVIIDSYLATAKVAASLLRAPEVAARWTEPSALAEFRISGLAGHLATAVFRVEQALEVDVPDEPPVDAAEYFARGDAPGRSPGEPRQQGIRRLGEEAAAEGPAALADRLDRAIDHLTTALPDEPTDRLVYGIRAVLPLDQWTLTRMIELAVHIDDLAVSLDVATPELPPEAADLVVTTLARIAVKHHGAIPVLRALSRRERVTAPICAF